MFRYPIHEDSTRVLNVNTFLIFLYWVAVFPCSLIYMPDLIEDLKSPSIFLIQIT